ncbi:hypothetical protein [Methanolapillus ohkumae]|uniref:Dna2/Cas4 domain-containing protein n=1 Tax=Methanolapillus ohkumae TaxID=3028298 RepID=A0AA96ZWE9_9EURY|nr:hypothetical protein MsAm2_02580 [Methanosarcinaceae archaeon Am2]
MKMMKMMKQPNILKPENKNEYISVFDLKTWMICPRLFFFQNSHREKNKTEWEEKNKYFFQKDPVRFFENEILREILFCLPEMILENAGEQENGTWVDFAGLENKIRQLIEDLREEMKLLESENPDEIKKDEIKADEIKKESGAGNNIFAAIDDACAEIVRKIPILIQNISKTIETYGFDLYEAAANPVKSEHVFYFQKINLAGAPHKVVLWKEKMVPYLLKTSAPPQNGIWEKDRIAAAAYILILEHEFKKENVADSFIMDYAGELRIGRIRPQDKKIVFRTLRQIKEAKNGKMPGEKNILFCPNCRFQENCRPKLVSILSRFWGKGE